VRFFILIFIDIEKHTSYDFKNMANSISEIFVMNYNKGGKK